MTVHLICGVPASGKTWICKKLMHKYAYIPHDDFIGRETDYLFALYRASKSDKKAITECPFAEREFRSKLESVGVEVKPVFVVEDPEIIRARYLLREKKEPQKASLTRALSIKDRALEWQSPFGTSDEILKYLTEQA